MSVKRKKYGGVEKTSLSKETGIYFSLLVSSGNKCT